MFQFPGLPSRRCGIFLSGRKPSKSVELHSFRADGGLDRALTLPPRSGSAYAMRPDVHGSARTAEDAEERTTLDRVADLRTDRSVDTSFRPIDLEKRTWPATGGNRSRDDALRFDTGAAYEHEAPPPKAPAYSSCSDDARDTECAAPKKDVSEVAADEEDDESLDGEVASALGDGRELLTHRNTKRRAYKRRRSLSRMSTGDGANRNRDSRKRGSRTGAIRRGAESRSRVRAARGSREKSETWSNGTGVAERTRRAVKHEPAAPRGTGVLSAVVKYVKYPVYVTTHVLSAYALLSYMGVDLTRVSSSLLRRIDGGAALTEFLRRIAPAVLNAAERLAVPATLGRS